MLSTTSLYTPDTTPDDYLQQVAVPAPRLVAVTTPAFTVPAEPAPEVEAPFWWMPIADTAPDPESPIFDQLMFEALEGWL